MAPESLPDDTDDRAALFRTVTAERRMLLVLDNVRAAAQVTPLLPGSGSSAVPVTSRHVLADLPDAAFVPLSPLGRSDQQALLSALCGTRRVLEEPAAAAALLDRCGGLPPALWASAAGRPRGGRGRSPWSRDGRPPARTGCGNRAWAPWTSTRPSPWATSPCGTAKEPASGPPPAPSGCWACGPGTS
ncbi:hypothetical protein [Streptomyces sp. NPDC005281]|uniref:hypothetical protein n=1 Tax=Streptomyces sp. NPDC005281 TaxID=3155712 RepID=UPI0033A88BA5